MTNVTVQTKGDSQMHKYSIALYQLEDTKQIELTVMDQHTAVLFAVTPDLNDPYITFRSGTRGVKLCSITTEQYDTNEDIRTIRNLLGL